MWRLSTWLLSMTVLLSHALQPGAAGQPGAASSVPGLFSSSEPVQLQLTAPFATLFALAGDRADDPVGGTLAYVDPVTAELVDVGTVQISMRGHTSRRPDECEFPKLKVVFDANTDRSARAGDRPGRLFDGVDQFRIGTHCGSRADGDLTPRFGRWANEKTAHREALVYRLLAAAGVPTLLARPARISYTFTDGGDPAAGARLSRDAMLLEDEDEAMRRMGAEGEIDEQTFRSARESFSAADTARLLFAEAMIGNFDWCLRLYPGDSYRCNGTHPLWNVLAARRDHEAVPMPYDFDLSGMVVGRHPWFTKIFDTRFLPAGSEADIEVLSQVQRARTYFSRDDLDATRLFFLERRPDLYTTLDDTDVDREGRALARRYLDAFFRIVENDEAFYRPVVAAPGARAYADRERTTVLCGGRSVAIGTPVAVTETAAGSSRARLMDVHWQWPAAGGCEAATHGAVWIETDAISSDFPR